MAIVKMKKLRVVAMARERKALLRSLLRLGCVEISEPDALQEESEWAALLRREESDLAGTRGEMADVNSALDALRRYAGAKDGMLAGRKAVREEDFLSEESTQAAGRASRRINDLLARLARNQSEQDRLAARKAALRPWAELELPLELRETGHAVFRLGVCPAGADAGTLRAALEAENLAAELLPVSADKLQQYLLLVAHKADAEAAQELLRPAGFSQVTFPDCAGTPADNLAVLDKALEKAVKEREEILKELAESGGDKEILQTYADRLTAQAAMDADTQRLVSDGIVVLFQGWVPAEKEAALGAVLQDYDCAWETEEPAPEEYPDVPVELKNNWFTRPLSMVTDMYSLPAYNGVDPNPLMAPFFILFYGIMMADMGYGLLMMLASWVIMKKANPNGPTMRHMIPLLGLCGVSTFIMGALTGGFFGDLIPQIVKMYHPESTFALPALFSPLDDALMVLIGSLALGLVQIFTGMAISMYKQIKRGEVMAALCNEGAWYLVFILAGGGIALGCVKQGLIAALVVIVLTQGYGKKGIGGKLMGIGGSLYNNITGYFSDILSYSRLMALMLAGAVIAQVFNTLGAITGNIFALFIISMLGNALNFALNLLGCFVHDMRLQCLEFFGRFYEDGGKPFRPLNITAKYVDIVKD